MSSRLVFYDSTKAGEDHPAGIQGQDLLIEAVQARLSLFHQLRFKGTLSITRHVDLKRPLLSLHGFLTGAIALVSRLVALATLFGIA